jgi:hypothetical protein
MGICWVSKFASMSRCFPFRVLRFKVPVGPLKAAFEELERYSKSSPYDTKIVPPVTTGL